MIQFDLHAYFFKRGWWIQPPTKPSIICKKKRSLQNRNSSMYQWTKALADRMNAPQNPSVSGGHTTCGRVQFSTSWMDGSASKVAWCGIMEVMEAAVFDDSWARYHPILGGGNSNIVYFHPYLGKIPILTNIFQRGWNHQPVFVCISIIFISTWSWWYDRIRPKVPKGSLTVRQLSQTVFFL